uniref:Uncharacterized protein n=1 Tax=Anguilla anguilla TaxID=7936 RepID=A0A0E9WFC2_ANGAN
MAPSPVKMYLLEDTAAALFLLLYTEAQKEVSLSLYCSAVRYTHTVQLDIFTQCN